MRSSPIAKSLALIGAFALSLVMMVFLFSEPVMAQATTGTLKGSVVDPNGQDVVGATITVQNEATGVASGTTASDAGLFSVTNLLPGKYTVTVAPTAGFSTKIVTGVNVKLGEVTDLKVELVVGAPTASVTISSDTEQTIQTDTSQISASFETRKVQDLPSNAAGSGIDTLALLAPGVVPGFGNVNNNGTTLSVNGNRARSNNFTIDGTDNNDLSIGGPSFFVDNQDAVQEYQVVTNNFSAQYGRNQGAVVNIVLKSGGNAFHGSGFEFLRNSALDAETNLERRDPNRAPASSGHGKDKFISNVFGGTFGGPIKKNKAFFFVTFQETRQASNSTITGGSLAPLPSEFAGLLAQYPGNPAIKAFVTQSAFGVTLPGLSVQPRGDTAVEKICLPKVANVAFSTAANCGNLGNDFTVLAARPLFSYAAPFNQPEFSIRGDMNVTKKDSFYVRYLYQKSPETFSLFSNEFLGDIPFNSRNLSGAYTRQISSHVTNEFRATKSKLAVLFGGGCSDTLTGCILDPTTGIDKTFTNITLSSIRGSGATSLRTIGPATNLPQGRSVQVLQFNDTLSLIEGRHSFIVGADLRHLTSSVPFLPNINGAFTFSNATQLVANDPLRVILVGGKSTLDYPENDKFFFFQDDWKVKDNLTLNLGIRYEYTGQPINLLNQISTARESDPAQALWLQSLPLDARVAPAVPLDKNNWAPRLGFAWTPRFGDGKFAKLLFGGNDASVIRGGFSYAYDPAFYNILLNVSTSAPVVFNNTIANNSCGTATGGCPGPALFQLPSNPSGDVVRTGLGAFLQKNTFDPRLLNQTRVGDNFHSPYSKQWSFGIQRQINRNTVAEVRYVGNKGIGLFQTNNRNPFLGDPSTPANGGIAFGFTSAGNGATSFTFPAFPQFVTGLTPLGAADCPTAVGVNNTAACRGRIIKGFGNIRSRDNTANSSYNSLQTRVNGRFANQLTYGVSYTFSKGLDNASEIFSFGESFTAANPLQNGKAERSYSGFDRRNALSSNIIWDLPLFKSQQGFAGKVLGGWQINGTWIAASGRRYTPEQFFNEAFGLRGYQDNSFLQSFAGFDAVRPFQANPGAPVGSVGVTAVDASYVFGAAFPACVQPCSPTAVSTQLYSLNILNTTGQLVPVNFNDVRYIFNGPGAAALFNNPFGTVARNTALGPRLNQVNAGLFKNTKIGEKVNLQLRMDVYNLFNHPNAGYGVAAGTSLPDNVIEDAGSNAGQTFQNFGEITHGYRRMQLGIRIVF
ncbi:MAG: carboxypeptidase regulatory-like domain-containing protein [bacterium]